MRRTNMKAPDKIFVSSDSFGFMHAYDMKNHPPHGEEYIRKNALLEWAKEQKEKLVSSDSFTTHGKRIMLERMIDKLKSM